MNIALCFCVRNCGIYLPNIIKNIENLKKLKFNIYSIFVYDNCTDNSKSILLEYKKNNKNVIVQNIINNSKLRTERIAKARNTCLDIVYNELDNILFHIMIDCDNRCSLKWNIDIINKYLNDYDNKGWDCISFNKNHYYDIWALCYDNIKHHCFGFEDDIDKVVNFMRKNIVYKLNHCKLDYIEVISAFNGFCIYKTKKFKDLFYDGSYTNYRNLFDDNDRKKTIEELAKNNIHVEIKDCGRLGRNECCEHLYYNICAYKRGNKITISKFKVIK